MLTCKHCDSVCYIKKLPFDAPRIDAIEMHGCQLDAGPATDSPHVDASHVLVDKQELQETELSEENIVASYDAAPKSNEASQFGVSSAESSESDQLTEEFTASGVEATQVDQSSVFAAPEGIDVGESDRELQSAGDANFLNSSVEKDVMLDWIQEEAESKEEAALEGVISEWKVTRANGQTFSFHFLVALRKWIMDGRITVGDEIVTHGGARYLVEKYPGTADLFENLDFMKERRRQVVANRKRKMQRQVTIKHFMRRPFEVTFGALSLSAMLFFSAYFGWTSFSEYKENRAQFKRGFQLVQSLKKLETQTPAVADFDAVSRLIWTDNLTAVDEGNLLLSGQVGRRPEPKAVCMLAEGLIRRAVLMGEGAGLTDALGLITWLNAKPTKAQCVERAQAVFDWSQGSYESALQAINNYIQATDDPFGFYIRALVRSEQQQWQQAKADLQAAITMRPTFTLFRSAMARVFDSETKYDEAIAVWLQALEIEPMNPRIMKGLAKTYEKHGNIEASASTYLAALQVAERPEEIRFLLVSLYNQHNKHKETIDAASEYLSDFPKGRYVDSVQRMTDIAFQAIEDDKIEQEEVYQRRMGYTSQSRRRIWVRR